VEWYLHEINKLKIRMEAASLLNKRLNCGRDIQLELQSEVKLHTNIITYNAQL
jgi:hypothetical protein